ncbi:MAG: hypothetical protein A2X61_07915 [Ignavibacteria bacterium GWB2_35_12]|nr:MAG: hypothetical protein A2X63_12950 [Ignavibacteria bacterium GWA2_35_8]OGU39510.1 MAG: hypothetical protein A2X61_07915 [Ignavibacteria bacterium GWB2_35_12]OGU90144.1 MAG: hypothetical protein A2220_16140 [Ignavibacteria bacterium RIFOXYA2_FULL_35_10]OGV21878.1 MAG: hypothetical protein A2475_09645 [Ignavibacteria bacterium RIFOXYC2_FULL_35_21]
MNPDIEKIIVFMTFDKPIEANIIMSKLESNGINCFLSDENIVSINLLYSNAVGGIKLHIFEKDLIEAQNLLMELNELEVEKESGKIQCPKCLSYNVTKGPSSKKRYGFWTILISFLFFIYPFKTKNVYCCFNCGNEF